MSHILETLDIREIEVEFDYFKIRLKIFKLLGDSNQASYRFFDC